MFVHCRKWILRYQKGLKVMMFFGLLPVIYYVALFLYQFGNHYGKFMRALYELVLKLAK